MSARGTVSRAGYGESVASSSRSASNTSIVRARIMRHALGQDGSGLADVERGVGMRARLLACSCLYRRRGRSLAPPISPIASSAAMRVRYAHG